MKFGTQYEPGEIVLVPFPFSDLSIIKQRPVLVLSKKEDNEICEDIITCAITSNLKEDKYSIFIDNNSLSNGKIPTKSKIKLDKLFTLDKKIVIKKIAKLNKNTFERVKGEFGKLI